MYNEPIIICGFSGIGKTTIVRSRHDILDPKYHTQSPCALGE